MVAANKVVAKVAVSAVASKVAVSAAATASHKPARTIFKGEPRLAHLFFLRKSHKEAQRILCFFMANRIRS